jgi:hypothetical protein
LVQNIQPSDQKYEAHQESTASAKLGSSTEQTVITETKRTTESTIRMEHKQNFMDLPVTFSQRTQTPTIPLVSEGTMVDSDINLDKKLATEAQTTVMDDLAALNFQPIRKHAFEFFENNIKNLPPVVDEKYTRYEDAVKSKNGQKNYEVVNDAFKSKINEDLQSLNILPEPTPEMGFMPKPAAFTTERISEKVKKLEYIHGQTAQTPLSGTVRVVPAQSPARPVPQFVKSEEKFEQQSFKKAETFENSFPRKSPLLDSFLHTDPISNRAASPKPSTEALAMEKLWTCKSPVPMSDTFTQQQFSHEKTSSFVSYSSQSQKLFSHPDQFAPVPAQYQPINVQPTPQPSVPIQSVCIQPIPPQGVFSQPEDTEQFLSPQQTKKLFEEKIKQSEKEKSLYDLKAPTLVKEVFKPSPSPKPQPIENIVSDLGIQRGTPPEILYAPKPVLERKESYVEKIEKTLEKNMDREPERVPRGGVRILPLQRTTPQRFKSESPHRIIASPIQPPQRDTVDSRFETHSETLVQQISSIRQEYPQLINQSPQDVDQRIEYPPAVFQEPILQFTPVTVTPTISEPTSNTPSLSGYRHVEPPKTFARPKSVEPVPLGPTQFECPKETNLILTSNIVPPKPESVPAPAPKKIETAPKSPAFKKTEFKKFTPSEVVTKPKQTFEFMSKEQGAFNAYKNFVKSEQSSFSSESYFRQNDQQVFEAPKNVAVEKPVTPSAPMTESFDYKKVCFECRL